MNADKFQKVLNKRILEHYLALDKQGNFVNPPKTDEDLDAFIRAAYGIRIPRKVITPGHRAPFEFVADLFFERTPAALGFANRAGGKTMSVALLNHLDMVFKRRCEICSAGAAKVQAERCYKHFRNFCNLPWFIEFSRKYEEVTGKPLWDEKASIRSHTEFGNGSRLEVITGSEKGFRGPHPHKSRIDEIDEVPLGLLETALCMAETRDGIMGQDVFTSTRQHSDGSMNYLLETAQERGIEVYQWNIWETLEKCNRRCKGDERFGDCPIWNFCKGKAHHCDGYFSVADFIKKVRIMDRVKFETEWLNLRPAQQSAVYHMFGRRHIMTPDSLYKMYGVREPQMSWFRVSGLDFGSSPGHPFVYLKFCQIPSGTHPWLLFYEYVAEQDLISNHARKIRTSPFYLPQEIIYADWDAQDRLELQAKGVRTRRAIKGPKSVNMGIDYICQLLSGLPPKEEPMLYFWHECSYSIREIQKYSWPIRMDGRPDRSGNPAKENDHVSDATRMALYSHKFRGVQKYAARQMRNV